MYQVEFAVGKVTELTTNIIAESMYTLCDADRNKYLILDLLVDYRKVNKVISPTKQQINILGRPVTQTSTAGKCAASGRIILTYGRSLLIERISSGPDSSVFCFMEDDHEPAFNWLVKHVPKTRDGIVASIKKQQTMYLKKNHEFGIGLTKTMEQALTLDVKNSNTL